MNESDAYRLEALLELAAEYPATITVAEVARRREIPTAFLARLLGELAHDDLVATTRGPRGGVRLALPPDEVDLTKLLRPEPPPEAGGPAVHWLAGRLEEVRERELAGLRLSGLLAIERERTEPSDFDI